MNEPDAPGALSRPRTIDQFPHAVEELENVWIPLPDGIRLAARIWRPEGAAAAPVPALLEYLPYRKRDGTATRDALTHPYFAGHGYACVRVDMRGAGEADGLLDDEYPQSEQDDALAVIDWLCAQDWCNGRIGMFGISWGGFNALQVAFRRPAALQAVITLCSTDDRYTDDIHFKGGCLLGENQGWGATMLAYQSRPPDPALRDDWREVWHQRMAAMPLLAHRWLTHQHRDDYWRHGSICEDYSRLDARVLTIGGWGDAYSNAVPRLLNGLGGDTRAIIGPWVHKYPHFAVPQPAIGFLQEGLRWWDRWLKDAPTGVEDDAPMRVYVMDSVRPKGWYTERPGRWYALEQWPTVDHGACETFALAPGRLVRDDTTGSGPVVGCGGSVVVRSPLVTGQAGGEFCAIWLGPEMPTDQRLDDGASVVFDTAPLGADLTLTGAAVFEVTVRVDQPVAQLAVRLCDVWPDGASTRVSYAVLNLAHRESHGAPTALVPGERVSLRIQLDDVGYRIPVGHRLRLAVSTAYWPMVWPSPELATVTLELDQARLRLPTLPDTASEAVSFEQPVSAPPLGETMLRADHHERTVSTDLATGEQVLRIVDDFGERRIDALDLRTESIARETYHIMPDDPGSARCETHWTEVVARDGLRLRTETFIEQRCDAGSFTVNARLEAYENDERVFEREWSEQATRNLV